MPKWRLAKKMLSECLFQPAQLFFDIYNKIKYIALNVNEYSFLFRQKINRPGSYEPTREVCETLPETTITNQR